MKIRTANNSDRIGDLFIVYGIRLTRGYHDEIIHSKVLNKYIFKFKDEYYFGCTLDIMHNLGETLACTFNREWFIDSINHHLEINNLSYLKIDKADKNSYLRQLFVEPVVEDDENVKVNLNETKM